MIVPVTKLKLMESVDYVSRDGPDTPIYTMHNKTQKVQSSYNFKMFNL